MVLAILELQFSSPDPNLARGLVSRLPSIISNNLSGSIVILIMFLFLSLSRLGLWIFDLTTQEITQTRVPSSQRASFAGTEMSFVSLFELTQWIVSAILSRPQDFKWLALGSLGAVACSSAMYAAWVRIQRGHLTHWDAVGKHCHCLRSRAS